MSRNRIATDTQPPSIWRWHVLPCSVLAALVLVLVVPTGRGGLPQDTAASGTPAQQRQPWTPSPVPSAQPTDGEPATEVAALPSRSTSR